MGVSEELGGLCAGDGCRHHHNRRAGQCAGRAGAAAVPHWGTRGKGHCAGHCLPCIGTARAMEMGEVEGAMSSLSIVVSGILTVAGASLFAMFR